MESLFVSCPPGLEEALAAETHALAASRAETWEVRAEPGGVAVRAPQTTFEVLNLWLRTAGRVLLRVAEVRTPEELKRVSLDAFRARGQAVRLELSGERREAWGRAGGAAFGASGGGGGEGRGASGGAARSGPRDGGGRGADGDDAHDDGALGVYLRGVRGSCVVSVDTSGAPLHFRGWRQEVGKAPMRETLAAGMLRLAGYDATKPLWDVMCGSGTLVIEAAEVALGLAAGRLREFAFQRFPSHDAASFAARPRSREPLAAKPVIVGSDLNAGALGVARRNAKRAGVFEQLVLERLDATRLQPRAGLGTGLVVANLPYGVRVGEKSELASLYRGLGQSLRTACPGWRFALLLEEGAEQLKLPIDTRHSLTNGGLQCELLIGSVPGGS